MGSMATMNSGDRDIGERRFEQIIGSSPALETVLEQVQRVAPTYSTVFIEGETGTGKELIARAIHNLSPRCGRPFIKLNCAAIPLDLLESELFGHEKGAFTGAIAQKIGRFELADKGTLFLDEVGDIPAALQPKLLRVATGARVRAAGKWPHASGGCSSCRGDQPQSRGDGCPTAISQRLVLSLKRVPRRHAASPFEAGRYSGPRRAFR